MTYVYCVDNIYADDEHMQLSVNVRVTQWTMKYPYVINQIEWLSYGFLEWSTTAACFFRSRKGTAVIVVHVQQPPYMLSVSVLPTNIVSCVFGKILIRIRPNTIRRILCNHL